MYYLVRRYDSLVVCDTVSSNTSKKKYFTGTITHIFCLGIFDASRVSEGDYSFVFHCNQVKGRDASMERIKELAILEIL